MKVIHWKCLQKLLKITEKPMTNAKPNETPKIFNVIFFIFIYLNYAKGIFHSFLLYHPLQLYQRIIKVFSYLSEPQLTKKKL